MSFPSPEDLPDPGIEPQSPEVQGYSLPTELRFIYKHINSLVPSEGWREQSVPGSSPWLVDNCLDPMSSHGLLYVLACVQDLSTVCI